MTQEKTEKDTLRIFVHGLVQGVNFRRWLQGEALERHVAGWVRNRTDGTVEALLHGERKAVDDLVRAVRACRNGPMLARVDQVRSEPAEYDGLVEDFRIEETV